MGTVQSSAMKTNWPPANVDGNKVKLATFAGGCFWGLELAFQRRTGVMSTCVGYTQGHVERPTYRQVCSGRTGHTEAVQLTYDTDAVTYKELCDLFFERIDAKTLNRQGNDVGTQYRSGVYYHDEEQRVVAQEAKDKINGAVTEILPATIFWPAEEYHQQYLEKGGQSAKKMCNDPIRCYG